jgi:thioredoxin reductase
MDDIWDTIVVGGGPAGLSAALMLGRARRAVVVVDGGSPRNRFAAHMHAVLGYDGAAPEELRDRGRAEAAGYGVVFQDGDAVAVADDARGLRVTLADGTTLVTRSLVVATGIDDDLPPIPGLAERWGRTTLHCPYCHGWEVRDGRLGVLVTSTAGIHHAQLIRQWSDDVTVFAAGGLDPAMTDRLRTRGVTVESESVVEVIGDADRMTGVRLGDGRIVPLDAVFAAGTPRPHDDFLAGLGLDRTDGPLGSFLTVDAAGRTSHPRVWATGNVVNPMANVPLSIGSGSLTGGAVNGALVDEDFDRAVAERHARV